MSKFIYLDVCSLSRPFDEQSAIRIRLETEAVNLILLSLLQKSLFRHSRESGNPELLEKPGFRVALRLPGMTISFQVQSFARASIESKRGPVQVDCFSYSR